MSRLSTSTPILRNRIAFFGWGFMAMWMAMISAFTWWFFQSRSIPGHSFELTVLFLIGGWLFGTAGSAFFFNRPVTSVHVHGDRVTLLERWPLRSSTQTFSVTDAARVVLRDEKDSEGDPYYVWYLLTPDGREVRIKEAHLRDIAARARANLLAALGLHDSAT